MKEQVKPRNLVLNLNDEDAAALCIKAAQAGLNVNELLENFVADLVDGTYSNGSDERMYADQWYDRTGFAMFQEKSFLSYLSDFCLLEEIFKTLDARAYSKKETIKLQQQLENPNYDDWKNLIIYSSKSKSEVPAYKNREAWEQEVEDDIMQNMDEIEAANELILNTWFDYLEWAKKKDSDLESELEIILEWRNKNQQFLGE